MPISDEWQLLDTYETKKFIEEINDPEFSALFNGPAYELWAQNLVFFDGYNHYSLTNKAMFPYFTLEYVSNGEDHYYLDGSEHPLEMLIARGTLRLTEENILDYLEFFSSVVFDPYRKVHFITQREGSPYSGASAMKHHFKTQKYHAKTSVTFDEDKESFFITMPVLYNGDTIKGHIQVQKTGEITILEPIHVSLMDKNREHEALHYSHPYEKDVWEQNIAILEQSEEAREILETVHSHGSAIKIMSGVGRKGFAPNKSLAYVVVPQNVDAYSPYQALDIAGIARELELQLMEEGRGDPFDDMDDFITMNSARNLDILLKMCKIAEELENAGFPEVLRKFRKAGFESIYSAYKNETPLDDLMGHYFELMGIEEIED